MLIPSQCLFLTAIILLISFNDLKAQNINGSIMHDGIQRQYILYIPNSYAAGSSAPLVINLHGYDSNRGEQLIYSNFAPIADEHGFLVVHPQGTLDNSGDAHWNANWGTGVDDVGFISALIDSLSVGYAIDLDRVYSTGMSNGGFMSYTLACQLSDRIAAIASVTGTMTIGQTALCDSPKPVMQIHGTADGVVPYAGSNFGSSIDGVIDFWVNKNACDTEPQFTMIEDTNMSDDSTVEHYVYNNGTDGSSVELYKIIGGGHTWPGAFNLGEDIVTNQDISATEKIWEFFSKYTLNGLVTSNEIIDSAKAVSIMPNPATDIIHLEFENDMSVKFISIYDLTGKVMKEIKLPTNNFQIEVADWAPATYFMQIYTDNEIITKKMTVIKNN